MENISVEEQKRVLQDMVIFFPDFFSEDYSIVGDKSVQDLRAEYLNYCEEYFELFGSECDSQRKIIKKSFDILKKRLDERDSIIESRYSIADNLLISYERLIAEIVDYSFSAHYQKSYGAKENRNNDAILLDLSLFKPFFISILKIISSHYKTVDSVKAANPSEITLFNNLSALVNSLNESSENLKVAKNKYHSIWNCVKRPRDYSFYYCGKLVTNSDLGKAKMEWKKARNAACRTILEFYSNIQHIIEYFAYEEGAKSISEIKVGLDACRENIMTGASMYSFLDKKEREELTEKNKAKKYGLISQNKIKN